MPIAVTKTSLTAAVHRAYFKLHSFQIQVQRDFG